MKSITIYLLSLGCAKNLVDSEVMSGALKHAQFTLVDDPAQAEVIIVNTCGFIEAAKKESIEAILELASYKEEGACRLLLAVGCMAEKYGEEMLAAMPELDGVSGSRDYARIAHLVEEHLGLHDHAAACSGDAYLLRDLPPGAAFAYLKIAEGCDNCCSYCLIPQLRGPYRSRPMEDILAEAKSLAGQGIRELILIAQDPTRYGYDRYGACRLVELLDQVAALPFAMIRLLYVYPDGIGDDLLQVMASHDNICHYLDMPIQHGVDRILSAMHRHSSSQDILDTIARIRRALPDAVLRSTVMVGFPGESEEDFAALLDFLELAQFDWLGAFPYSREEDTPAAEFAGQIDDDIKQQRLDTVMQQAAEITGRRLRRFIGRKLLVLAEEPAPDLGGGWFRGRSAYQAPEVDGVIYFAPHPAAETQAGQLYEVEITDTDLYDLMGAIR